MGALVDIRGSMPRHPKVKVSYRDVSAIDSIAVHHSLTESGTPQAFANYHINDLGWSIMGYTYVIGRDGTIYWCADYNIRTPHVGNSNNKALGVCMVGDFRTGKQTPTYQQRRSLIQIIKIIKEKLKKPNIKVLGHQEYPGYSKKDCPTSVSNVKAFMKDIKDQEKIGVPPLNPSSQTNPKPSTPTTGQHKVVKGDTLWSISQKYKTTVANLQKLNPNVKPESLVVGSTLKVSGTATPRKTYPGTLIREGSRGENVKAIQRVLKVAVDGIFGAKTKAAVKSFQRARGLAVDGIIGKATWGAMFN